MNKEVRDLAKQLKLRGFQIKQTGAGHVQVLRNGSVVYGLPSSPSDHRWRMNAITDMKRLGLILKDPIKETRKKTNGKTGVSPPPAVGPLLERKEVIAVVESGLTASEKQRATVLFHEVADAYGLKPRTGRATGHGCVPVLAYVLWAYEAATDIPIPSFHYANRDLSDRVEAGRLCANRAADWVANVAVGTGVSKVGRDGLYYCELAWAWHVDNDLVFPDGRTLRLYGQKIEVIHPEPDPETTVDWFGGPTTVTTTATPIATTYTGSLSTGMFFTKNEDPNANPVPLSYRLLAALVEQGSDVDTAMLLAMEAKALEAD